MVCVVWQRRVDALANWLTAWSVRRAGIVVIRPFGVSLSIGRLEGGGFRKSGII